MSTNDNGSRLPVWALTPTEELEARHNLKDFTHQQCADVVADMMNCAKEHGLKAFPACNKQKEAMSRCLLFYQKDPKYLDAERDKIIRKKIQKLELDMKKSNSANPTVN
ncbi:hypothetical protein TBLA_0B09120 [Henningerozyma blattae CBS 6284]|uniref:COX assembly mitochondrial protein n=1 Tax=Henningerozyma blattae (strain ATCC 34711 / CBS 6284 / DSM 70876 / NBRC 10599 / NRRL Y-10934 / UCD 77-7) TaxID=1071380 RepID=I2H025_HENB6|nr:hypothetical protein TBLA_0B09120 [Tetrapisispora blattae CBS 6284]CCH59727.1 hypothetical protein TBLA_0B09120 [Tetrapisispora blattae CBS 6284]